MVKIMQKNVNNLPKKNYPVPKKSSFALKEPNSVYKNMLKKGEAKLKPMPNDKMKPNIIQNEKNNAKKDLFDNKLRKQRTIEYKI